MNEIREIHIIESMQCSEVQKTHEIAGLRKISKIIQYKNVYSDRFSVESGIQSMLERSGPPLSFDVIVDVGFSLSKFSFLFLLSNFVRKILIVPPVFL